MDRSEEKNKRDGFVGFRCDSNIKECAERRAEEQGVSLSEWMRRQLDDLNDTAGPKPATT